MVKFNKKEEYKKLKEKYKTNSKGTKRKRNITNIHHLTRIITYLSEVDCAYKKQISDATGLMNVIPSAITFLLNNKIIFLKRSQAAGKLYVDYYALNPLFKK